MKPGAPEALDRALKGQQKPDPELEPLVDSARELRSALATEAPGARRERAMFVQGVAARRTGFPLMARIAPAMALGALFALVGFIGRGALPGDTLWTVREALGRVGVVATPMEVVDARIASARRSIERGSATVERAPQRAIDLASQAIASLERASKDLGKLDGSHPAREETIDRLHTRAVGVIARAFDERADNRERGGDDEPGDDHGRNRGPGGGDDEPGDDHGGNRGPGGGDDDGDDDSGQGRGRGRGRGGDDSGSDDGGSSGKGSDDFDSDDRADDDGSGSGSDDALGATATRTVTRSTARSDDGVESESDDSSGSGGSDDSGEGGED